MVNYILWVGKINLYYVLIKTRLFLFVCCLDSIKVMGNRTAFIIEIDTNYIIQNYIIYTDLPKIFVPIDNLCH